MNPRRIQVAALAAMLLASPGAQARLAAAAEIVQIDAPFRFGRPLGPISFTDTMRSYMVSARLELGSVQARDNIRFLTDFLAAAQAALEAEKDPSKRDAVLLSAWESVPDALVSRADSGSDIKVLATDLEIYQRLSSSFNIRREVESRIEAARVALAKVSVADSVRDGVKDWQAGSAPDAAAAQAAAPRVYSGRADGPDLAHKDPPPPPDDAAARPERPATARPALWSAVSGLFARAGDSAKRFWRDDRGSFDPRAEQKVQATMAYLKFLASAPRPQPKARSGKWANVLAMAMIVGPMLGIMALPALGLIAPLPAAFFLMTRPAWGFAMAGIAGAVATYAGNFLREAGNLKSDIDTYAMTLGTFLQTLSFAGLARAMLAEQPALAHAVGHVFQGACVLNGLMCMVFTLMIARYQLSKSRPRRQ